MAWVPKYFYDVFLSYAHVDNEGSDRWVSRFQTELEHQLQVKLGAWGDRRATVWMDEKNRMKPGYVIGDTIKQALARTAAVVSLYSPGYVASGYCGKERAEFETLCGDRLRCGNISRLLNVVLGSDANVRRAVAGSALYADFTRDGAEMGKLAAALKELLTAMREQFPPVYVALPVEPGSDAGQKTLEILNALSTAGYRRTSETHPLHLRDSQELQEEIRSGLLSVHVVDDPGDDLALRQIRAAAGAGKPMLVWLSDTARRSPAADEIYRIVPGKGREVSAAFFSEFRERVVQLLPRIVSGQWPEPPPPVRARKTIFFLFHPQKDGTDAASVLRRLQNDFEVTRQGGPTCESDGVLVYQKEAGDKWFETKLSVIKDMRGVKGAWPVAPPDKDAALRAASDFRFRYAPEIDPIDPRLLLNSADPDPLRPFVDLVKGSPPA